MWFYEPCRDCTVLLEGVGPSASRMNAESSASGGISGFSLSDLCLCVQDWEGCFPPEGQGTLCGCDFLSSSLKQKLPEVQKKKEKRKLPPEKEPKPAWFLQAKAPATSGEPLMLALLPGARRLCHCSRVWAAEQSSPSFCCLGTAREDPQPLLQDLQAQEPLLWGVDPWLMMKEGMLHPAQHSPLPSCSGQGKGTTPSTRISPALIRLLLISSTWANRGKGGLGETPPAQDRVKGQYCLSSPRGLKDSSLG